jgi:hypothetical protein
MSSSVVSRARAVTLLSSVQVMVLRHHSDKHLPMETRGQVEESLRELGEMLALDPDVLSEMHLAILLDIVDRHRGLVSKRTLAYWESVRERARGKRLARREEDVMAAIKGDASNEAAANEAAANEAAAIGMGEAYLDRARADLGYYYASLVISVLVAGNSVLVGPRWPADNTGLVLSAVLGLTLGGLLLRSLGRGASGLWVRR